MVSPIALEAAKSIPPTIPGKAAGMITFLIVSDLVAPKPYEPSRIAWGTAEITSSDKEETSGMIIIPITKPTPRALSEAISKPMVTPKSLMKGAKVIAAKNP